MLGAFLCGLRYLVNRWWHLPRNSARWRRSPPPNPRRNNEGLALASEPTASMP